MALKVAIVSSVLPLRLRRHLTGAQAWRSLGESPASDGERIMQRQCPTTAIVSRWIASLAIIVCAFVPRMVWSQTPSPLQEWQYPGGTILEKLYDPNLQDWRVVLGAAVAAMPRYDGAQSYRETPAPVIVILYRDIAFASVGEGLGVNLVRGDNYRAGISIGYDLGRPMSDEYQHLHGLGDVSAAPVVKVFGSYVISKALPLVLRADVRRIVGGANGLLGDLDAFMPLPGSSKTFIMFAGPTITFSNRQYMRKVFGVSAAQASATDFPIYDAHGGLTAAGLGFSASRFITQHWLINADLAYNRLLGSASGSPITQSTVQGVVEFSTAYRW
jgi:outer membrane scaffolding protein for murein synthesis (MipA/OmpV family)